MKHFVVACELSVTGLVGALLLSGCGAAPPPTGIAPDPSVASATPGGADTASAPAAPAYVTVATTPKDNPQQGKTHLEFGDDMADVLARYRSEAEAGAELVAKAEAAAPRGNSETLEVPVPEGDALRLARDVQDRFYLFRLRDVDAYLAHTKDPDAARQPSEEFLRGYINSYMQRPDAPTSERVHALANQAIDAGSTDPLVRTYRAFLKQGFDAGPEETDKELLAVADELKQSAYPRIVHAFARARLCKLGRDLGRATDDRLGAVQAAFVEWLAAEQPDPQWRSCVLARYEHASSLLTAGEKEAVLAACLRSGTADPWLMHHLLGLYYVDLGWHYRGVAFASEVSQEGWQRMQENVPLGALHLRYAWALDPTLPAPARKMILVSGAGYDFEASPYDWFLRATSAQFDDWDAYVWMLEMLSQRWGGSVDAQYAFGEQCLLTDRFDTTIPYISMFTIEKTWSESAHNPAKAKPLIKKYLEKRQAAMDAQPGKTLAVDNPWARSSLALRMFREEMNTEAVAELGPLGHNIHVSTFQYAGALGEFYANTQMARFTVDNTATDEISRFLSNPWPPATSAGMFKRPKKLIADFTPRATNDQSSRFFLHAARITEQLERRASGEWTELRFDEKLPGWEVYVDRWILDAQANALSVWRSEGGTAQLRIRPIADFRPPLEIELDLEVLQPFPYPQAVGLHWVRNMWSASDWTPAQPLFGIESRLEVTPTGATRRDFAALPVGTERLEYAPLPTTGVHKLRLRLWDNAYEFQVDGLGWSKKLPEAMAPDKMLGFGEAFPHQSQDGGPIDGGGFRISNVRLRNLWDASPFK